MIASLIGVPFITAIERGVLQSQQMYRTVGTSMIAEQVGRLFFGVILAAAGLGATGAFLGTPLTMLAVTIVVGIRLHRAKGVVYATGAAPEELAFVEIERAGRLDADDDDVTLYAAARLDGNEMIVIGRHGGPEFLDSEIARLGHLTSLAQSIVRVG